jgi:peptidoglycan-N-acetylglucosamine deacetylase
VALFRIPSAFPLLFRDLCWKIPAQENVIYLTFDDGPEPAVTPFVLDILKQYNASATFFCVGKNVETNPDLYKRIISEGHSVGNHTYSHLKGWSTDTTSYLEDVGACTKLVDSALFRPPYGKISFRQYKELSKKFTIVLWDVITHDYDVTLDKTVALKKSIESVKPGSVIVFHDSLKAKDNLEFMLPALMKHFSEKGYRFEALSSELCKGAIS